MSSPLVSIVKCHDYDPDHVRSAVDQALTAVGGITAIVKKGQKVLLKPNMLSARKPEKAVTTHPMVLEAMLEQVHSVGGIPVVGDSPSGAIKGVKRCWENTGFLDVCQRHGVELINFEKSGAEARTVNDITYHISKAVLNADVVINLPKMKTHGFTLYTGAIKNLYGTLPGLQKANFHKLYPHPQNFSRLLVDIYGFVRPALHLMDGVVGMEGHGPATGIKRQNSLILASTDGVALDAVVAFLMGFKPGQIDMIRIAGERKLGKAMLNEIDIKGESLAGSVMTGYDLPSNRLMTLIPEWLMRRIAKLIWVRPEVVKSDCVSCGICAEGCPVDAIIMKDKYPVFDYDLCINCLCCNESCSEGAIKQRLSWLARKIG
ncbi:DUF362 domain-containing protein [bacterium]|nr:DUF362 domain-containing protein [bacterium]